MRRLPVLQNSVEPTTRSRPGWQWILVETALTLLIWTPLAWPATRFGPSGVAGSFVVACALGAATATRFGDAVSWRQVLASGALSASVCLVVALLAGGVAAVIPGIAAYVVLLLLALAGSWFGWWLVARPGAAFHASKSRRDKLSQAENENAQNGE